MRILVLTQMYPPHHHGGYELLCEDIVERWRAAGNVVEVLTTSYRRPELSESNDTNVRRQLRFYWDDYRILRPSLLATIAIEATNQRALKRALGDLRPDVVSVWHMGAMSLGLLQTIADRGIPMVLVVGDDWLVYGPGVDAWTSRFSKSPAKARFARLITRLPAGLTRPGPLAACFASEFLRSRAIERSPVALSQTSVEPHGVDVATFNPPGRARPWTWRLLYVGRVEERKGVHIAVQALTSLPEATLDIVGAADAAYVERLRRTIREMGLGARVRLSGAVGRATVAERYRNADALLFPAVWDEPFGLVPLEAMACETPVIATGTGGSAEYLIAEENCLLVPPGDPAALAGAVRSLAENEALRRKLRSGGRSTAERLSVDRLARALDAWNRAAVSGFRELPSTDRSPLYPFGRAASEPDPAG